MQESERDEKGKVWLDLTFMYKGYDMSNELIRIRGGNDKRKPPLLDNVNGDRPSRLKRDILRQIYILFGKLSDLLQIARRDGYRITKMQFDY
jgi:hypothetical protein